MKYAAGLLCLLLAAALSAASQSIPKELLATPVRIELDHPTMEVKADSAVRYTVTLRNAENQAVPASSDLALQVETPSGQQTVLLLRGQSSASFMWQAKNVGIAQMTVRAGKLRPASAIVLVAAKPIAETMAPLSAREHAQPPSRPKVEVLAPKAGKRPAHPPLGAVIAEHPVIAMEQPAPVATPAPSPQATKLQLYVTPLPVYGNAVQRKWTASVSVAAAGSHDEFVPVSSPVQVHLNSELGQFSAPDFILQPGEVSSFSTPAILTTTRAGLDKVQALSSLGTAGPVQVEFLQPPPASLTITPGTPQLLGSGSSTSQVQVCLADEAGAPAVSNQEVDAILSAPGQLSKSIVRIAAGTPCGEEITWTAAKAGLANIAAKASDASGALSGQASVVFPAFPWYLVWLAALGGVVGAVVQHARGLFSRRWWAHTWRSLVVGAVLGIIVYLLARFGALVLPKEVPVTLQNIPAVTGVGSFVIGCIGGIFGRKLFKVEDDEESEPPQPPAARGAAVGP